VTGFMLVALLLSWGCVNASAGVVAGSADESKTLAATVFQYLDTTDSEEADRILNDIQAHPNASIEGVTKIIQSGRVYGPQPTGMFPEGQVVVRGRAYPLSLSIPATYDPSKSVGLVVCLHGAGFTGDAYLERWRGRLGEGYLLACPTYPSGAWFTRRAEELVLAAIRDLRTRYHVDPNRIFLTGMSNGGIGTWLIGMHHAPLFAGIAPMASGLDDALMPFLANLRDTPIYIIHGAKDQVMPVELSRTISRELDRLGYFHVYREHEREHPMAGGHYFPKEELPDLVMWLDGRRRGPLPARLTVVREASHFQAFNWLRLESTDPIASFSENLVDNRDERIMRREYAKLDASIVDTNRIEVTAERVRRYSIFLNDRLVDVSKPVTVLTNGEVSFKGAVRPSLETLLRQARLRQDPRELFSVQLTVTIPNRP
jgi:pimeloyl-ACP methyl ester carboxylesterase